jgi:hypothetical protein
MTSLSGSTPDRVPEMQVRGVVSLDGVTVYVNGMHLADVIAAFVPVRDSTTSGWYLNITITDLGA